MKPPSPRFRRLATLVAIDPDERVALLLCPGSSTAPWTLPRCTVLPWETYPEAATRLAVQCFAGGGVRWGSVIGRRWAPLPGDTRQVRVEEHLFLVHTDPSLPCSVGANGLGSSAVWMPRVALDSLLQEPHRDTTATLVDGYLDGWLPDGPITLH